MIKQKKIKMAFTSLCIFLGFTMSSFTDSKALNKLKQINQEQLLNCWDNLNDDEKKNLVEQIEQIDCDTFNKQRQVILDPLNFSENQITPFMDYEIAGMDEDKERGLNLIAAGEVGCLIVAGGQGSRLGYEGPKGMFPVTIVKNKSFFQLFAEKVLAAGRQVNRKLLLAIMTSSVNHADTVKFFVENNYFGLDTDQIYFFSQTDLPFLNDEGNMFLETPSKIAAGPDGNAASLKHFVNQGIWSEWYNKGVRYLNYIHIDNALADPFDAELIGFHSRHDSDLVIKCIKRADPLEKVGVILKNNGKVQVIEYSEITDEERLARNEENELKHLCANISLFSFKMHFVKTLVDTHYSSFPFHKAWKAVKYLDNNGITKMSAEPQAWKFEKFIFDLLPYAQHVKALLFKREECFAPLKNAVGPDSLMDVQKALQIFDQAKFSLLTQKPVTMSKIFELDPQFYYPTEELKEKWRDRSLPVDAYILP